MTRNSNKISSFTLIELILVLILLGLIYSIFLPKFNIKSTKDKTKIELYNLKEFLVKNFEFNNEIRFSCISKDFSCYVYVDRVLLDDFKVEKFFKVEPLVYKYNKNLENYDLGRISIDGFTEDLIFEYKLDSDFKSNEFILDTKDNKVYLFNSIFYRPKIFKDVYGVIENIEKNINGVKGAF